MVYSTYGLTVPKMAATAAFKKTPVNTVKNPKYARKVTVNDRKINDEANP
jgi:hypothetical protein